MRYVSLPLLIAIFLTGCGKESSPTVFVDPALAVLVPPDTIFLAGVRVQKMAQTQFWRDYVQKGRVPMMANFQKKTGLNPEKDLWEILVASSTKEALVLVRGKFSDMGMEPKLQLEGAKRMSYKGFTLIGDEKAAVLFLNPSTAAAGPTPSLHKLVDNRGNVVGVPAALNQRIQKISSANQAWFAAQAGGVLPDLSGVDAGMLTGLARMSKSVQFASGGLDVSSQFAAKVDIEATDAQAAERLGGAIRGLLGLGRLNTGEKQKEILSVFDGMQVTKQENVVHFSTEIPYAVLEKAATELPMLGVR
jgi:hypothetical protein